MIHKYNRKNLIKKFKLYSGVIKQCSSIIKFNYKIYYISKRIHKLKKKFSLILKRKKNKIRLIFLRKNFRNYSFFIIKLSKIVYSNYFYNSSFLTSIFFRFFSIKKKLLLKLKFFFYFFLFLNNNVFLNDF